MEAPKQGGSMRERVYFFSLGTVLLAGLYFELNPLVYLLIGLLFFEGVTNLRIARGQEAIHASGVIAMGQVATAARGRIDIDALRVWRLVMASVLLLCHALFYDMAWFVLWALGFAMLGAGLSGCCPLVFSLRLLGFK